jgi:hypothetical protein
MFYELEMSLDTWWLHEETWIDITMDYQVYKVEGIRFMVLHLPVYGFLSEGDLVMRW